MWAECAILLVVGPPTESDVFISYAADTRPLAEELTRALQQRGIHAWADFKDLQPGQRWRDEIEHALDRAHSFLILVGPHSRTTPWQEVEWRAALSKVWSHSDKRIIPVIVGDNETPPFLRQWVSLRIDPAAEPGIWTDQVLRALRSTPDPAVHGLTSEDRRERRQRLNEITHAAEELGKSEPDGGEPPANPKA